MRHCLRVSALLMALLFLLPLATVSVIPSREETGVREPELVERLPAGQSDSAVTIRVLLEGEVEEMPLSDYLQCVLRAEMPASFEHEALCAQAVAARTYTYYKMHTGGSHGQSADICGDSACCQAFLTGEKAAQNWGEEAEAYEEKIQNAVSATDGQMMLFEGEPILAVFHSSSAGQTKDSGQVWTQALPYLQSVSSPEEGEGIPNYYSRVELTADAFRARFLAAHPEANLSGEASGWIQNITVGTGGGVDHVSIGGVRIRGTEVRSLFSLRSTSFEMAVEGENIVFYVTGYGHGVGMSQYGANTMAQNGSSWQEILQHYYTGITLGRWPEPLQ